MQPPMLAYVVAAFAVVVTVEGVQLEAKGAASTAASSTESSVKPLVRSEKDNRKASPEKAAVSELSTDDRLDKPVDKGLGEPLGGGAFSLLESSEDPVSEKDGNLDTELREVEVEAAPQPQGDLLELAVLVPAPTQPGGNTSRFCAHEHSVCDCHGIMMYGSGNSWVTLRTDGPVNCTSSEFEHASPAFSASGIDDPEQSTQAVKICKCYDLGWCDAKAEKFPIFMIDKADRRRQTAGTQGRNFNQRRRWCGVGPRDCVMGEWTAWGNCCGGLQSRSREKLEDPANGGKPCPKQPEVETRSCDDDNCPVTTN